MDKVLKLMEDYGYSIDVAMNMIVGASSGGGGGGGGGSDVRAAGGTFNLPNAAGGSFGIPHAIGSSFMIPPSVGNEAFRMAGGHTATGGERVTITPQMKDVIDYRKLARAIREAMAG
jgi:hypothetical protein